MGDAAAVHADVVDPSEPAAVECLAAYFAELDARFPSGFDPGDAGAEADLASLRPPSGAFVVLRHGQDAVGCGGVQRVDEGTGEVKRMWIHPDWRGLGLGRRLLAQLEDLARTLGYGGVVLDTNATLVEAVAMYEGAGYEPIERYNENPYAQHWFAKALADP